VDGSFFVHNSFGDLLDTLGMDINLSVDGSFGKPFLSDLDTASINKIYRC